MARAATRPIVTPIQFKKTLSDFAIGGCLISEMQEKTDAQLLRDYAEQRNEAAFRELVSRHADVVYASALRQVSSPDLAHDIAQSVFTDLARKAQPLARTLTGDASLLGWLFRSTRFLALNQLRDDRRRQARERHAMQHCDSASETAPEWERVQPVLDEAMADLSDEDRDALLLRFFKNRDFHAIGATLGVSDDAAQKRVSRALERLRTQLTSRGVTTGVALSTVLSTNAVPLAPAGLAATLSTAALTGTTLATTATAVKTIAMTTLQKTIITATIATAVGTGIYEAHQASTLRTQVQTLEQQQAPLTDQIKQFARDRDESAREIVVLREDNDRLSRNTAELLKLRGEVGVLRNAARVSMQANPADSSTEAAAKSWLHRANQLKQYAEQNPNEKIPEFQFLNDREWLIVSGDAGIETESFQKEADYKRVLQTLRFQAENRFGHRVQESLQKYGAANNEQFPNELSQLGPYCDPAVMDTLNTLYEIKPANILPENVRKDINVKFDWVITRKQRVNSNSTSRLAILTYGEAYWQSPP